MARAEVVEQPAYEEVDRVGGVEIRRYGSRLAAEADMGSGAGVETGQGSAFMALANFIFAKDRQGPGIAMTAPVAFERAWEPIAMTAPVAMEAAERGRVMRFYMPAEYTVSTLPRPADDRVRIVTVPAQTLAVLRYAGRLGDAEVVENTAQLLRELKGSAWSPVGEPGVFGYDPPGVPPAAQRNEVFVEVVAAESTRPTR